MTGEENKYYIARIPDLASVTQDAVIQYTCEGPKTQMLGPGPGTIAEGVRWFIYKDRETEGGKYKFVYDLAFGWSKTYEWDVKPGKYVVVAEVRTALKPEAKPKVCILRQYVMTETEAHSEIVKMLGQAERAGLANPDDADNLIAEQIEVLTRIGQNSKLPLTAKQQEQHQKTLKQYEEYRQKVQEHLQSTQGKRRIPIYAVHLDYASQVRRQLNFFLSKIGQEDGEQQWRLVDWTNPVNRAERSESDGEGKTDKEAIADVVDDWDWWHGRYPPGKIMFKIPAEACGEELTFELETDGETTWDTIIGYLTTAALVGGMIVIGAATLGAAVPCEAAATAAIWGTVFSSVTGTGAEILSIIQRRNEGIQDWKADAFSALSIIGNIFAVKAQWIKGATVLLGAERGVKAGRYIFVGAVTMEVGTDMAQGVLIAEGLFKDYQNIIDDPDLLPEERERRLMEFFRSLAVASSISYLMIKRDMVEFRDVAKQRGVSIGKSSMKYKVQDLANDTKIIDTNEPKIIEGDVAKGKTKTVVDTEEAPLKRKKGSAGKKPPKALPAAARGMTRVEDEAFKELSKGRVYFVRDCNKARLKRLQDTGAKLKPKPMEIKFKTLKQGKFEGVAAAGPDDPEVQKILKTHGYTIKEGAAPPWDYRQDNDKFLEYMKKKGLTVGAADEQYIVRDAQGYMYVSDIDVHGVYDLKTGNRIQLDQAEITRINDELGGKWVLHGAHDDWTDRLNKEVAGINYGPQPPVTAYIDGQAYSLNSWEDMRAFAKQHGLQLDKEYAAVDWAHWQGQQSQKAQLGGTGP